MTENPWLALGDGVLETLVLFMVLLTGILMLSSLAANPALGPQAQHIAGEGIKSLTIISEFPDPSDILTILGIIIGAIGVGLGVGVGVMVSIERIFGSNRGR